ncbi:MAG: hypothetical protein N3A53_02065 [Verrucomicrobiae bacterium]|nr:hypothetical protein [Verrucomicrobiae bacterium]
MNTMMRLSLLLALVISMCGCKTVVAPGADPVVVRAEQTAEVALETFDAFLRWERANSAALPESVRAVARDIRLHGKRWIVELREATKAYKRDRNGNNLDRVLFAQKLLEIAVNEIKLQTAKPK